MNNKLEKKYEHLVDLKNIKILDEFLATPIKEAKLKRKKDYYYRFGKLQSKILLTEDYTLVDGYSSYLIALEAGLNNLPVYILRSID